ncbi:WAP, follistatin/kazal, immunoglobulin, kunitz and netrin domain containing 2 [Rhinolophus ferrumequinum]|uniref:WAP, Kazal, immunoglobulin, Kunitz and NTR domain-containing protein 2 n=2 Tax=Rhinolophus ferrumequinum TaxID=59479 RepID=A0A671EQ82_RHIFE|nr:WAP, Kazal, immunoglobulin, Kunitz and NTR domain-containing protein 2 isoform X1 [Rhinolophus ferrumequinum]KAF6300140.1 WAP, follistatin/kazal, immunoglobulin, kunitz and netrin domain containing 2 [Rhinolophus ferrumequinum]
MWALRCCRFWSHWGQVAALLLLLLLGVSPRGLALPPIRYSHAGICPNDMNPNLWVDAQSTCKRECETDQECETYEKCCPNVCGTKSCVAARYMDVKGKKGPVGMPKEATCDHFMCLQQGSECDIWDGQPVCKCKDRCEKEPSFTCASDGLTYYNRCYMDAEACSKGITLAVVTCRYHFTWPNTSPPPPETTVHPTTALPETPGLDMAAPALLNHPVHESVTVGETVSFLCDVVGRPRPEITWEKQLEDRENVVMRPNHVRGNVVVTNIAQLVIYNAQLQDAGIYTCTARNAAGVLRADFPLSVVRGGQAAATADSTPNGTAFPAAECLKPPDSEDCGEEQTRWHFDTQANNCLTFTFGHCHRNRNHFETYEACMLACMSGPLALCSLPALQGPCKAYAPRWAYNSQTGQCQSFVYGGCEGNGNNFESREACEESCPFPRGNQRCRACKPRQKLVTSFCRSDFVILGRVSELTEEPDSGRALVTVDEVLKDEKMGLKFLGREPLEVTLLHVDWTCPCPNVTAGETPLLIMGEVDAGMAVLRPDSFVGASSTRRVRKLREVMHKKTCDVLKEFLGSH